MQFERFVFEDIAHTRPLKFVANRYRFPTFPEGKSGGTILLLMHGVGLNKETWEPFLEDIAAADTRDGRSPTLKEAWTYDLPSAGESGLLNEAYLFGKGGKATCASATLEEWAMAGLKVLTSGHIKDLNKHRLIFVGHSGGTLTSIWLSKLYHAIPGHQRVAGCVFIEPPAETFYTPPFTDLRTLLFIEFAKKKKEIWASQEEAKAFFKKKMPWNTWDPRALEAFTRFGLRDLPSARYPDKQGATLTLTREQDIWAWGNYPEVNTCAAMYPEFERTIPFHVWVAELSLISPTDEECEELKKKGIPINILPPESGHMALTEVPKQIATEVLDTLDKLPRRPAGRLLEARL